MNLWWQIPVFVFVLMYFVNGLRLPAAKKKTLVVAVALDLIVFGSGVLLVSLVFLFGWVVAR